MYTESLSEFRSQYPYVNQLIHDMTEVAEVYAVGGSVRDMLMGLEVQDIDLVHSLSVEEMLTYLRNKGYYCAETGMDFGVFQVVFKEGKVDVVEFRAETYKYGDRHPEVRRVQTIEEDLERRDFTINAIALRFNSDGSTTLVDPFGGLRDLEARRVRFVGNPRQRLEEDSLRGFRLCRFGARLMNFEIEESSLRAVRDFVKLTEKSTTEP